MQGHYKNYMDTLFEMKEILKTDRGRRRNLKYAIRNHELILFNPTIKLRSQIEEDCLLLRNKKGDGCGSLHHNFCVNTKIKARSSSEQKHVPDLFKKDTSKFTNSYIKESCYDITTHEEASSIQSNNLHTRSSLLSLLNAVKEKYLSTFEYPSIDNESLMGHLNNQKKTKASLKNCIVSGNCIIDVSSDSSKPSSSLQHSFVTNIFKFGLINKDVLRHRCEVNNVQCQIPTLSKIIPTCETSLSHSYSEQINFNNPITLSQKIGISKIEKVPKMSVGQNISAISSESDLSSCITPIIKSSTKNYSHRKSGRKSSRSLSQSSRRIQGRSHSNESSCTLPSIIRRDRRSFSYSSRSSLSSRLSRYIFSESSISRSPSIPRRYGSPSFLERRRITSARKRPIPYRRQSPSSSSNSPISISSKNSFRSSPYADWSPESNITMDSYKSQYLID